ncbi:MAG: hypothetical protein ABMB14_02990 [Myxococcota bacterium]
MRHSISFALALLVSLSMADSAFAKKKKDEAPPAETTDAAAPAEDAAKEPMSLEITMTGIADVDKVFSAAVEPLKTVADTKATMDKLNTNVATALGLTEGTPLADAFADLKTKAEGKINAGINAQGMPELKASDAVPANVQATIDAFNNSINEVAAMVPKLQAVPGQLSQVVAAAQTFNPKTLMSSGVKATEAPKIMKTITGNLKVVGSAPDQVTALMSSLDSIKSTVTSTFGG